MKQWKAYFLSLNLLGGASLSWSQDAVWDSLTTPESFAQISKKETAPSRPEFWIGLRPLAGIYKGDNYNLGKGLALEGARQIWNFSEAFVQLGWLSYSVENDAPGEAELAPLDEYHLLLGARHEVASVELKFRVGGHLGYTFIQGKGWNHFAEVGLDIVPLVPLTQKMAVAALFQPSFVLGSSSEVLFRLGLSLHYRVI